MKLMIALAIFVAQAAAPQTVAEIRRLYDAGKYKEAVDALSTATDGAESGPALFLAGQGRMKLNDVIGARQAFTRLATRPQPDSWKFVGESALAAMDKRYDDAVNAAKQATMQAPPTAEAQFQLGTALMQKGDFGQAAQAFDRAGQIDPNYAYAFYYAGMAYYRQKRLDVMAQRFETFLRLAPNAPEKGEVESIMRTVRGR